MKIAQTTIEAVHTDWVSLELYSKLSGYSVTTIRGFIKSHWTHGVEYVNRGRIAVNVEKADASWLRGLKKGKTLSESSYTDGAGRSKASPPRRRSKRLPLQEGESNQG